MPDDSPHERISVIWTNEARANLRAIAQETALQLLHCLDRYITNRSGDVKKLRPPRTGLRLRCGDYRIFFEPHPDNIVLITGVRNRSEAYR